MVLAAFVAIWVSHSGRLLVLLRQPPRRPSIRSAAPTTPGVAPISVEPGSTVVNGQLTFRGNATRTLYGQGPVPKHPSVLWTYPDKAMCSQSHDLAGFAEWCGTGWTGEPAAVWERDGRTLVAFGAYDRALHVLDAATGGRLPAVRHRRSHQGLGQHRPRRLPADLQRIARRLLPRLLLRSAAAHRAVEVVGVRRVADEVEQRLGRVRLVRDDYLFEGGENSQFHIVKLNRAMGADGKVTVAPKLVFHAPGWDDQELQDIGGDDVSIESSVSMFNNVVYFANSGGLIEGWDVSGLATSGTTPKQVFRFWTGRRH